ncbi:MAG TPA: hypothetical protein VHP83_26440 [Aggregatilineaceae bacterium]|nr:hypothetical protein [Aggregatilineaceae bacterium]
MTTIPADEVEITIQHGFWELIPNGDTLSRQPVFQVSRGSGVMEYTPAFGQNHRLPGTVLSVEYVRAVVIGYDEKTRRWMLGFHIARTTNDPPRWLELVRWPPGDNMTHGAAAQQAGRTLSEHIGCPLKIFGAKKLARPLAPTATGGVTGPLVPHKREDVGPQQVKLLAQSIHLPLEYPNMRLEKTRSGLVLRLGKESNTPKRGVTPSFNQVSIDQSTIRLMPPTGLLGSFLSGQQGRAVKTSDVRNVEFRHSVLKEAVTKEDSQGLITESMITTHLWEIYFTLPDESLLIAQTSHTTSSELSHHRATALNDKFAVDPESGIEYLRKHQADQEAYDAASGWAESVALVIASTLGTRLVKTTSEEAQD